MRGLPWLLLTGCIIIPPGNNPPLTCDAALEAVDDALADVQSCDVDADCGQPIVGTSCGCTRDLVARVDADLTAYEDAVQAAADQQCEVGATGVCDCPAAAGFICSEEKVCEWNYLEPFDYLPDCTNDNGAPFTVLDASINGSDLELEVEYSGGCAPHEFTLCWPSQAFQESAPVQATLDLFHDDGDDACDGIETETLVLSLLPLQEAYEASYSSSTGSVIVNVQDKSVTHTF